MIKLEFLTLFIAIFVTGSSVFGQNCFRSGYSLFGTKTLYRDVRGNLPQSYPRGCSPVSIYMMSRHGARYPGDDLFEVQQTLEELAQNINVTGRASLCHEDLEMLRNWRTFTTVYDDKNLTEYGAGEARNLASRYRDFLPQFLGTNNEPNRYLFSATDKARNIRTMNSFIESLFNYSSAKIEQAPIEEILPQELDPLEFDDSCPRFVREVDNNPNISVEYDKFIEGRKIGVLARKLTRRLGLPKSSISNQFVVDLYTVCYSETFLRTTRSPWCNIFSKYDLRVLEYASDLEDYPAESYQFPITYQQNCQVAKELFSFMASSRQSDRNGTSSLLGRFRFVSNKNVLTLAATLGLYERQNSLLASAFTTERRRSFRTSLLAPSVSNLAFVLYRCNQRNQNPSYSFQIYWNERLLTSYPGCRDATRRRIGLCDLDLWMDRNQLYVAGSTDECNSEEICA